MTGALSLEAEQALMRKTKDWLREQSAHFPALTEYERNWSDWNPWP